MDSQQSGARLREKLSRGEAVDFRGDGKAGGGLVLALQAFGGAIAKSGELDVQDWPFFSSARKGANVRAFLRVAKGQVQATCQVSKPDVALLMNPAAAESVDFAEGTHEGIYVINTPISPQDAAKKYRLAGFVATVAGDDLGQKHLNRRLGNISAFAALVKITDLVDPGVARTSLESTLKKRRLPDHIVTANLALFDDSLEQVRIAQIPAAGDTDHRKAVFHGYGQLPAGAQSALRTAKANNTSGYGRPGVKIAFDDPTSKCNGCALCVVQCPEGIITFKPDPARGPIVTGALFNEYCKVCRECVTACPLDLFSEVAAVTRPDGALADS